MDQNQVPPALAQVFQGQPQGPIPSQPPQNGPGDPTHDAFVATATGQQQQPSAPPILQRGRIGPSSNPILNILGKLTGRGSYDYTAGPADANQAPVANTIAGLTGVAAPQSYQPGGYLTPTDVGTQKAVGDTVLQNRAALMMQMFNMVPPSQVRAILKYHPEDAEQLIKGSTDSGFGGWLPKETMQSKLTALQQNMEGNKAVAGEAGKQGASVVQSNFFKTQIGKLENLLTQYKDIPLGLGQTAGAISNATGGHIATPNMKIAGLVDSLGSSIGTELNTDLAHRFNLEEMTLLRNNMVPNSTDAPDMRMIKLRNLKDYVNSVASGNQTNIENVSSAIAGRPVHYMAPFTSPTQPQNPAPNVGDIFHGAKVTKVTIIKKAP